MGNIMVAPPFYNALYGIDYTDYRTLHKSDSRYHINYVNGGAIMILPQKCYVRGKMKGSTSEIALEKGIISQVYTYECTFIAAMLFSVQIRSFDQISTSSNNKVVLLGSSK